MKQANSSVSLISRGHFHTQNIHQPYVCFMIFSVASSKSVSVLVQCVPALRLYQLVFVFCSSPPSSSELWRLDSASQSISSHLDCEGQLNHVSQSEHRTCFSTVDCCHTYKLTIQPSPFPLHPSMRIPSMNRSCTFKQEATSKLQHFLFSDNNHSLTFL